MALSKEERETTINWSQGEGKCTYYTAIKKEIRKMDKLCKKFPDEIKCVEKDADCATYEYPAKWNIIRRARVLTAEETEKRREAMKGRLEDMRERKEKKQCSNTKKKSDKKSVKPEKTEKTEKKSSTTAKESTAPEKKKTAAVSPVSTEKSKKAKK